jgi:hypothetical protein
MSAYPLYDVPWLVRDPNEYRMSAARHAIELRNQAVVDDYFILRDQGLSSLEARNRLAAKHHLTKKRIRNIITWFFHEARKRKKYDFLIKFALMEEH